MDISELKVNLSILTQDQLLAQSSEASVSKILTTEYPACEGAIDPAQK